MTHQDINGNNKITVGNNDRCSLHYNIPKKDGVPASQPSEGLKPSEGFPKRDGILSSQPSEGLKPSEDYCNKLIEIQMEVKQL